MYKQPIATLSEPQREIDTKSISSFVPQQQYLDSMPDVSLWPIVGAKVNIPKVGIYDFRAPLAITTKSGSHQQVSASITGTVSLEAEKKGINMSRIIRTFYDQLGCEKGDNIPTFDINTLSNVLEKYREDLDTFESQIIIDFEYRMWIPSLRSVNKDGSKPGGWQYYKTSFECSIDKTGHLNKIINIDFVYSSACPCSTELSYHASAERSVNGIPHSQRSVMRCSVAFEEFVWIEDIIEEMRDALKTETVVFCKREDEQAFAELNYVNTKFVEDAIRLVYRNLDKMKNVVDFKIIASHNESLHSHNAIGVSSKQGSVLFTDDITVPELKSLVY